MVYLLRHFGSGRVFSLLVHDDFPGANYLLGGGASIRSEFPLDARGSGGGYHCGSRPPIGRTIPSYVSTLVIAQFKYPAHLRSSFQDLSPGNTDSRSGSRVPVSRALSPMVLKTVVSAN